MASLGQVFDVTTLPQGNGNFEPLPAGWYSATITKAELSPTKDGTGEYIKLRYDITGPSHQGRVVFGNLNIKNKSAQAEEIGRQQLGDLMRAIGLARVTDTDELIGKSLQIKLDIKPADGKYEASNDVKGYKALSGSLPASFNSPSGESSAHATNASPAKAAPPWAKK